MAEAIDEMTKRQVLEIPVGKSNTTSDYSSRSCHVLTFINKPDGSGIEVYESSTDNLNPHNYEPDVPWHDRRDLIDEVPANTEYTRPIVDACGVLSQLIVRSAVELDVPRQR